MGVHHLDARLGALRRTIAAARRTAWYGELLADLSVEEVSALEVVPLTRTEDLKVRAHTDFLAVDRSEVFHYHQSFGTTGKPSCGWYSLPDLEAEVPIISNWLRDFGPGAVILNRYPYSFPVPNALVETAARLLGGCVIPAGAATNNSFVRTVHLLRDQKVTVVASLPWEPFFLAETARLLGLDPARDFPHLEGWIVAGSLVPPRMRALIEELWGCKVRILYDIAVGAQTLGEMSEARNKTED